ncbi:hypothetical protein NQ318_008871, partial [Aromia moschata]
QLSSNADRTAHLSPQQQGHILSDIQQHHRFNLPNAQSSLGLSNIQSDQLTRQRQILAQSDLFNQQLTGQQNQQQQSTLQLGQQQNQLLQQPNLLNQQQFVSQPQNPVPQSNQFSQNQFLSDLSLANPLSTTSVLLERSRLALLNQRQALSGNDRTQAVLNPVDTLQNPLHNQAQTNYQPSFVSQPRAGQVSDPIATLGGQFIKPRPTIDPIVAIEQQIKLLDPEKNKQKIKELREKQAIRKKALKKAQVDHEVFVDEQREQKKKLYQKLYKPPGIENLHYSHASVPRYIYPEEINLFEHAHDSQEKYEERQIGACLLPTAVPSPATRVKTIQSLEDLDLLQKQYKSQKIRKDDLLEQLRLAIGRDPEADSVKNLASREISLSNGKKVQFIEAGKDIPNGKEEELTLPNGETVTVIRANNPNIPNYSSLKPEEITLPNGQTVQVLKTTNPKLAPNLNSEEPQEITLPNGQKAQLIRSDSPQLVGAASVPATYKTEEITLPNGEKVEIIKTTDPNLVPGGVKLEPGSELEKLVLSRTTTTTTIKPPKAILDELTKSVPGSNFELLKTGASGGLESIGKNLPNQKRVTFVLLEEQSDGTLKVQGVKGNGKDKPDVDVDSILRKIKAGEIKLPKKTEPPTTTTAKPDVSTTYKPSSSITISPNSFTSDDGSLNKYSTNLPTQLPTYYTKQPTFDTSEFISQDTANIPILKTNIGTHIVASSTPSSIYTNPYSSSVRSTTPRLPTSYQGNSAKPTRTPHILNYSQNDLIKQASTVSSLNQNSLATNTFISATHLPKTTGADLPSSSFNIYQSVSPTEPTTATIVYQNLLQPTQESIQQRVELPDVLRKNGLYAMAKFLRQSGLDTILNETGPYTVFVPTDKAFRTLLVQLGGPEKAEEKFRENPRLLSGLLLHHVIPGAFTIGSLQDEMTGVSLAGTQLRVNRYNMQDVEWNEVKITTINGAKVLEEKKDIEIPQGIAHAIDRVMFPLPVGDIVQTLQSDRERRFTSFLRAIFASGLAETLQGSKTFTLFAPTDKAFTGLSSEDLSRTVTDKVLARELVLRHLLPGTLYTNGMRYYQIKDSLLQDKQLTFSKQSGWPIENGNTAVKKLFIILSGRNFFLKIDIKNFA